MRRLAAPALGLALLLGGCAPDPFTDTPGSPRPQARPEAASAAQSQAELRRARAERNRAANAVARQASASPSQASQSQRDYYAAAELATGGAGPPSPRPDPAGRADRRRDPDTQLHRHRCATNTARPDGGLVSQSARAPLRRWQGPVRMQLEFGASTDMAARPAWRSEVADFAGRLSDATRHPVSLTAEGGNFTILDPDRG